MRNPQGYWIIGGGVTPEEYDTITCGHCNKIVRVKPGTGCTIYILEGLHVDPITKEHKIIRKEEAGASCRQCMRSICLPCCDKGECTPLMKQIEAQEARGRLLKSLGL